MQITDNYTAVQIIEGSIHGSQQERLDAYQHLVNTGLVWRLSGPLVKAAGSLLKAGLIKEITPQSPVGCEEAAGVTRAAPTPKRWKAFTAFTNGTGSVQEIEELEELQSIVEHGPDWNTIVEIKVTLNR